MYMDVKVEAIMPRVVMEAALDAPNQKDRPKTMQIQISRFALTNIREMGSSRADLAQALHSLQEGSLVFGTGFPSVEGDMCIVTDRILSHVAASDVSMMSTPMSPMQQAQLPRSASTQYLSRYAMWSEPRDVWCIKLDPIWVDFLGARSLGPNKSIPFVDAVPITLWLHSGNSAQTQAQLEVDRRQSTASSHMESMGFAPLPSLPPLPRNPFLSDEDVRMLHPPAKEAAAATPIERSADMHAIVHISNLVSLQIDHYQLLFLLRLAEEFNEMSTFLNLDAERILQKVSGHSNRHIRCTPNLQKYILTFQFGSKINKSP